MTRRVLFLCTGNSARSVLAESTLKKWGARVHWGLFDPAGVEGSDAQKAEAFDRAHQIIKRRLQAFLEIPDSAWDDRVALKARIDPIAQID